MPLQAFQQRYNLSLYASFSLLGLTCVLLQPCPARRQDTRSLVLAMPPELVASRNLLIAEPHVRAELAHDANDPPRRLVLG